MLILFYHNGNLTWCFRANICLLKHVQYFTPMIQDDIVTIVANYDQFTVIFQVHEIAIGIYADSGLLLDMLTFMELL